MQVKKSADMLDGGQQISWEQMDKINLYTKKPLEPQDVYVFSVRLCDNQVDRDGEQFSTSALPILGELFLGKTCICDHQWSSGQQVARIFDTQVVSEGDLSYLKGWGYLLQTQVDLIAQLDGGIKKEVSVGCAMGKRICSVCGQDYDSCPHEKGTAYKGATCFIVLDEPLDAYEVSFVAVPAQPLAGVLKMRKGGETVESELAVLGRMYQKKLENELVSMGLSLDFGLEKSMLQSLATKLEPLELAQFHGALGKKFQQMYPQGCQLPGADGALTLCEDEFLI